MNKRFGFLCLASCLQADRGLGRENNEETGLREYGSVGHRVDWLSELVLFQVGLPVGLFSLD